jgi:hypothetical protein
MRAKSSAYKSKQTASCPNIGGVSPSKAFSRFSRPFMKRPNRSGLRGTIHNNLTHTGRGPTLAMEGHGEEEDLRDNSK